MPENKQNNDNGAKRESDEIERKNRETKKQQNRRYRQFLKAKYNEKVGYWFKGTWAYLTSDKMTFKKPVGYIVLALAVVLTAINIFRLVETQSVNDEIEAVENEIEALQRPLNEINDELSGQSARLDEFSIAPTRDYIIAYDRLDNLFESMYEYSDGKAYVENRAAAVELFKKPDSEAVEELYSTGIDSDGMNMIDTLDLSSSYHGMSLYTEKPGIKSEGTVEFYARVVYDSKNATSEPTNRKHTAVYKIEYDIDDNLINKMSFVNTMDEPR